MGKKCLAVSAQTVDTGGKDAAISRKKNIRKNRDKDLPTGGMMIEDDEEVDHDQSTTNQT